MKRFTNKKTQSAIDLIISSLDLKCPCEAYEAFSGEEQEELRYIVAMLARMQETVKYLNKQSESLSQSRNPDSQVQASIHEEILNLLTIGRRKR